METRNLPEDTVFYEVYSNSGDDQVSLEHLRIEILKEVEPKLVRHIWQEEPFRLHNSRRVARPWPTAGKSSGLAGTSTHSASPSPSAEEPACLWGQTAHGDNIEEEWLIVWLLHGLSQSLPITVRIWDSDGDFLLIQAAYALPKWLKPDVAANRVWIKDGMLHLIPLPSPDHPQLPMRPALHEALQILQESSISTLGPSNMQAAIAVKLGDYPEKLEKDTHHAAVVLPEPVAAVLQQDPQLISSVVGALYHRDPEDLKAARNMRHFPPDEVSVQTVVRFSRCLYAQMQSQMYQPPRQVMLPLPSERDYPAAILGAKIVAGFEMLLARSPAERGENRRLSRQEEGQWNTFLEGLKRSGAFGGEIEGSAKYKADLEKARLAFLTQLRQRTQSLGSQDPAERCRQLLAADNPFDPYLVPGKPESDAWLAEGQMEIEAELKLREAEAKSDLASGFKSFLGKDFGEDLDDDDDSDIISDNNAGMMGDDGDMDFNTETFLKEMRKALRLDQGNADDGSSEEGSSFYGEYSDEEDNPRDYTEIDRIVNQPNPGAPYTVPSRTTNRDRKRSFGAFNGMPEEGTQKAGPSDADLSHAHGKKEAEWDAKTATDSDDEEERAGSGDEFDKAYDEALKTEYRQNLPHANTAGGQPGPSGDDLAPVDLDMNLVQNLLSSYEAQQGLPGPVGNLAGMLGLNLNSGGR